MFTTPMVCHYATTAGRRATVAGCHGTGDRRGVGTDRFASAPLRVALPRWSWPLSPHFPQPGYAERQLTNMACPEVSSDERSPWHTPDTNHSNSARFTSVERREARRIRDPDRRRSWLLGRLLARRCILDHLGRDAGRPCGDRAVRIHIDSGDIRHHRTRPLVSVDGQHQPWSLSIAHTRSAALVALAGDAHVSVGVDLVVPVSCGPGFARLWLTGAERAWVGNPPDPIRTARVWAVKEAVYKACNQGEPFRPARIEVFPRPGGQYMSSCDSRPLPRGSAIRVLQFDRCIAALAVVPSAARRTG